MHIAENVLSKLPSTMTLNETRSVHHQIMETKIPSIDDQTITNTSEIFPIPDDDLV